MDLNNFYRINTNKDSSKKYINLRNIDYSLSCENITDDDKEKLTNCIDSMTLPDILSAVKRLISCIDNHSYKNINNVLFISLIISRKFLKSIVHNKGDEYNAKICKGLFKLLKEFYTAENIDISMYATYRKYLFAIDSTINTVNIEIKYDDVIQSIDNLSESASIIKAITNYSQYVPYSRLKIDVKKSPDEYLSEMYNDTSTEYVISKIHVLLDYFDAISDLSLTENYPTAITALSYFYTAVRFNSTGLKILKETLLKIINMLNDKIYDQINQLRCDDIVEFINSMIKSIDNSMNDQAQANIMDSSPMIEFGFGYIYDKYPVSLDDINESSIRYVDFDEIENSMFDVLRENIFDSVKQVVDENHDINRRKKEDKYERERSRKNELYDIETAKIKKKKTEMNLTLDKAKTLTLTTPLVYQAVSGLKKAIKAVIVGGVGALAGFNPIFAGALYLVGKFVKDKQFPASEKRKIMMEINDQIEIIDKKIEDAERRDDDKSKYALITMKNKLSKMYAQCGYALKGR